MNNKNLQNKFKQQELTTRQLEDTHMEQEIHFKEWVINLIEQILYKDSILYTIQVQCKNCYRERIVNDGAKGEGIIMNFKGATLT